MPDYSKSIIYTIRTGDSVYVGSTTEFTKRKYQHKSKINECNFKLYKTIRDNGGEWDMKPYKEFPCENKLQLNIEEERIRCELKADLNSQSCYGNDMERKKEMRKKWRENNSEKENKCALEYYHKNKEKINARRKKDKNKD